MKIGKKALEWVLERIQYLMDDEPIKDSSPLAWLKLDVQIELENVRYNGLRVTGLVEWMNAVILNPDRDERILQSVWQNLRHELEAEIY